MEHVSRPRPGRETIGFVGEATRSANTAIMDRDDKQGNHLDGGIAP